MELYCRVVNIFDEVLMNDFAKDHIDNNTEILAGDCSLLLGKNYHAYDNFYDNCLSLYNEYAMQDYKKLAIQNFEYNPDVW